MDSSAEAMTNRDPPATAALATDTEANRLPMQYVMSSYTQHLLCMWQCSAIRIQGVATRSPGIGVGVLIKSALPVWPSMPQRTLALS